MVPPPPREVDDRSLDMEETTSDISWATKSTSLIPAVMGVCGIGTLGGGLTLLDVVDRSKPLAVAVVDVEAERVCG